MEHVPDLIEQLPTMRPRTAAISTTSRCSPPWRRHKCVRSPGARRRRTTPIRRAVPPAVGLGEGWYPLSRYRPFRPHLTCRFAGALVMKQRRIGRATAGTGWAIHRSIPPMPIVACGPQFSNDSRPNTVAISATEPSTTAKKRSGTSRIFRDRMAATEPPTKHSEKRGGRSRRSPGTRRCRRSRRRRRRARRGSDAVPAKKRLRLDHEKHE